MKKGVSFRIFDLIIFDGVMAFFNLEFAFAMRASATLVHILSDFSDFLTLT